MTKFSYLLIGALLAGGMALTAFADGEHDMGGKITSINHKSGVLVVNSEGMSLKVHFPPATIKDLKKGDTITVHLGFSK